MKDFSLRLSKKECNYGLQINHWLNLIMTCFLFSHARDLHARSGKTEGQKRCPLCPFVLNGLVLSLLILKSPFWPVLWPFCPGLCPF